MPNDGVILHDFPVIARHWPYCFLGCVEAIATYQFDSAPFADCAYDHTFHFERKPGGIHRVEDGTDLDLQFGPVQVDVVESFERVLQAGGLEYRIHYLSSPSDFEPFVLDALRAGRPLAADFDWFYVAGRREYRSIHAPHYVCLFGVEPGQGTVHVQEQHHGRLQIPGSEFAEFLEYSCQDGRPGARFVEFLRADHLDHAAPNRLVELRQNVERFLENLESKDSRYGLAALRAFKDELDGLMALERDTPRVFYVPGMWQFSSSRTHLVEALQLIEKAHPEFSIPNRSEFMRQLNVIYRCWFELNADAETALIANQPAKLAEAMAGLNAIIGFERAMPRHFERLLRSLSAALGARRAV
jgi:hypothetical protein